MNVRGESALLGIVACLTTVASLPATAQTPHAAPRYQLAVMRPLAGHNECGAHGLNDRGQAVGNCFKFDEDVGENSITPFLWQGGTSVTPLPIPPRAFPYSPVYSINNNGWVAGVFDAGAVIFKGPGNIETIARGSAGMGWFPADVNARGDVVGNGEDSSGGTTPFIYKDGVKTDLTSANVSSANAINYGRQVAATCVVAAPGGGTEDRACVYANGRAVPLRGSLLRRSQALDLNNKDQVVGAYRKTGIPARQGFLYNNGAVTNLGANVPYSINNSGTIVGKNTSTGVPFVRIGATVYSLPGTITNPGNFVLEDVWQINEGNAIVGRGHYADKPTQRRGFILRPVP